MTEYEAKKKECPEHIKAISITMIIAKTLGGISDDEVDVIGKKIFCTASDCMMWEPEYEEESMDISEDDNTPEGWHEKSGGVECNKHKYVGVIGKSRLVFRYLEIASGDCGLKTKENGCFYPG